MKTIAQPAVITPTIIGLALLFAAITFIVVTSKKVPLLSNVRVDIILCTTIGVTVIAQTTSQTLAGFVFPIGVYIGMIGSWVVMGAFAVGLAISFFRNISEKE